MSEEDFDNCLEKVKEAIMELRVGICPVYECGGELEYLGDRTNWQEPDLKCKNCGTLWLIQKYEEELKKIAETTEKLEDKHGKRN